MQKRKIAGYAAGSAEYIQVLSRRASMVFALFIGLNALMFGGPGWQWVTGLAMTYTLYNFGLNRRKASPGGAELLLSLGICAALTYLQAEYSSILYHLLLLQLALRVGRNRIKRVALIISMVYLAAALATKTNAATAVIMQLSYNLIGFGLLTYAVIYIDTLVAKQANDDQQMMELIKQNDRNYRMALTDALTGLYNHRAYKEKVDSLAQYVLLIIDLDHFKKLNDNYGHLVGDKVLVTIGNIIKLSVRSGDLAFRYGGEEFVVILPGTTAQIGMKIAERLHRKVAEWPFEQVSVTISIGVSIKKPGMSAQSVFEQADTALYQAKQSGRNRVQSFVEAPSRVSVKYGM
jgi:diguanylate cyclase (GGDEF)-like protein